jgi:hypothetical protein
VLRSPGLGAPLSPQVGAPIAAGLGVDVSPVRVHADAAAAGAAEAVSARAFTYGTHVYLGRGERSSDLGLVAHEVAHVVQQQGLPAVQLFGGGPDAGPLEQEAQRAAAAVVRGESAAVVGRTTPVVQRQFGWLRRAAGAVAGAVRSAASAVGEFAGGLLDRAIDFIKERARSIPGYDLVAFALGRDPVTQQPVERTASNLLRAVVGLIPGGAAIFENLQRSGALQRAFEWVTGELERLGLTWTNIRGAIARFLATLGPGDLLNLGGVFERARAIFGPLLSRAVQFALAAGKKLFQFVFEAVMASAGGQRILAIFRRIGETFELIVADPVRFIGNLVSAVRGGFQRFAANIIGHLRTALFEWLLGALRGALTLPSRWDLAGIVSVILQILGLTYQALRARLVRLIGERAVSYIETAFEFIRTILTRGLAAAWDKIVEFATGLVDTVVEAVRNWVAGSIVGAAVTRLVTMFNPVGAIIQSIIAIYNTIMFFVERAQQIAALLEAIVDSISSIARGNIGAAISYIERTMARFLPVLISFLARFIGLGNVTGTIREIIGRIRATVDRAIDRIVDWVIARVRGLIARVREGVQGPDQRTPEQKQRDLDQAVADGTALLRDESRTPEQVRRALPAIRSRYRLASLTLVTDARQPGRETAHVEGAVNPATVGPGVTRTVVTITLPIDLTAHENVAGAGLGHTIAKHVGKDDTFLRNRLKTEAHIPGAFSYVNLAQANDAVNDVLTRHRTEVEAWLTAAGGAPKVFKDAYTGAGYGYRRPPPPNDQNHAAIDAAPRTIEQMVRVVLRKGGPSGWYVHTSFPDF